MISLNQYICLELNFLALLFVNTHKDIIFVNIENAQWTKVLHWDINPVY